MLLRRLAPDCRHLLCLECTLGFASHPAYQRRADCLASESGYSLGGYSGDNHLGAHVHLMFKSRTQFTLTSVSKRTLTNIRVRFNLQKLASI